MRTVITRKRTYRNIVNIRWASGKAILRDSGGWTIEIDADDFIAARWQ
jgi:hypothetical protein